VRKAVRGNSDGLGVAEAARLLRVSRARVYALIQEGRLPARDVRLRGALRRKLVLDRAAVMALVAARATELAAIDDGADTSHIEPRRRGGLVVAAATWRRRGRERRRI
jgi:excisionase family DNA binding protein